jgi:hypothetical protein
MANIRRYALIALGRALIAASFLDQLMSLPKIVEVLISSPSTVFSTPYTFIGVPLSVVVIALAVASIVSGSVTLFALAIILSALAQGLHSFSIASIAMFVAYLAVDTIATGYRGEESRSVKVDIISVIKSSAKPLTIVTAVTVAGALLMLFISRIVEAIAKAQPLNPLVREVMESPATGIVIAIASLVYAYRVVKDLGEIIAGFIAPAPRSSLNTLLSTHDIDALFTPIFKWVLYISISALLYAPITALVFKALLPGLVEGLDDVAKLMIYVVSYLLILILVRFLDPLELGFERRVFAASIALLVLVYIASVKLSIPTLGWKAIISPDLSRLGTIIAESYADYSEAVFTLINTLSRIVGAAP